MVKKQLLVLWLLLVFSAGSVMAKEYAYVYIEGDKQTPFYVKLEGQMMPRLGKNYCIIPNMDAGVTNIEILFQQNQFPAQKFTIKVPEGGARGFLLKKVNERQFALYDMQQGFYLVAGNSADDDRIDGAVPANGGNPVISGTTAVINSGAADLPAFVPGGSSVTQPAKNKKPKGQAVSETAMPPATTTSDDKFIRDIELNTDGGAAAPLVAIVPVAASAPVTDAPVKPKKPKKAAPGSDSASHIAAADADEFDDDKKPAAPALVAAGIPNSDCKNPMSNEVFEDFAAKILDQTTDDDKLKVLSRSKNRDCFNTEQVRIIANNFDTQSGRYEVVKMLFPRTSDQDNYPKLEALFKTGYLKEKFRQIMNPK